MAIAFGEKKMELLKIKKRKGISPLIATLLLIAIAVAASVLTYSWVMSMIGSQSAQAQTQVRIDAITWNLGADNFAATVRNTGSVDAQIESVAIRQNSSGQPFTFYNPDPVPTVAVGKTLSVTPSASLMDLDPSTSYVLRVTTTSGFYYEASFTTPTS